MAAVPVTIVGIETRDDGSSSNVTIVGLASLTGLAVGGGPMPGGPPPQIWGPTDPRPTPPIAGIPGLPGYEPPLTIWGPTDPRPTHPIVIPPPPPDVDQPPPAGVKPPPPDGGWGYSPDYGWGYFPGPTQASPKR